MTADPPAARIPPPAMLASGTAAAVLAALPGARAVGGAVRDLLAGRAVHDIDIAAPLPPEAIAQCLEAAGLKVFATGLAHGTVTAVRAGEPVEVTSLRRDVVTDGRHAQVAWTTDWREDAARRDFTINAMSLSAGGDLWDYFGGRQDLAAGRVRFVGDPATRLAEDYLRALRFFRFQARYGAGAPDAAAIAAIRGAVPGLARLSAERVWMEIKRLLAAPDPAPALALMAETGVLGAVLPEGFDVARVAAMVAIVAPPDPLLRFAALLAEGVRAAAVGQRLRLSRHEMTALRTMRHFAHAPPCDSDENALRAWASEAGPHADAASWLAQIALGGDCWGGRRRYILAHGDELIFPLQGQDALDIGVAPGAAVGALLGDTLTWWRAHGCRAGRDASLAHLRELASARGLI
jgi:poly(A) polymerase